MDPRIPIPTDNFHKFLATFGLYLTMLCLALLVININYSNSVIGETINAMYDLGDISTGTEAEISDKTAMQSYLKSKLDNALSDRNTITYWLLGFLAVGILMTAKGFTVWYKKIQPQQDRMTDLEEEKLSLEVAELRRQAASHNSTAPDGSE
ncbi:hypothetical protein ADIMK_2657 [Marinobacterium lacunae]|uniref:Uncharacterized protein n=1 Tax=Marinobacterium lacunae TaxID=1232683 RepID=A0A081FX78_9GAMM|nr:hypothetical protein [Marinobacterium lacunae]KEA63133.1 hypothetical protein ADIMK_2657 [Marinobacterium lacunae]